MIWPTSTTPYTISNMSGKSSVSSMSYCPFLDCMIFFIETAAVMGPPRLRKRFVLPGRAQSERDTAGRIKLGEERHQRRFGKIYGHHHGLIGPASRPCAVRARRRQADELKIRAETRADDAGGEHVGAKIGVNHLVARDIVSVAVFFRLAGYHVAPRRTERMLQGDLGVKQVRKF